MSLKVYFFPIRALHRKELRQDAAALFAKHAADCQDAMIESRILGQSVKRSAGAGFRIERAEDQSRNPRLHDRSRAHRAWFQCDVETSPFEPPVADGNRRSCDRQHFSVGKRIAPAVSLVAAGSDQFAVADEDRADRSFLSGERLFRQLQGGPHPTFVVVRRQAIRFL